MMKNCFYRKPPSNFIEADREYFESSFKEELPNPEYKLYKNVIIFYNGTSINLNGFIDASLVYKNRYIKTSLLKFILIVFKKIASCNIQVIKDKNHKYVNLVNEYSNNYFHWMTEVIPKILFLKEKIGDFTLLLNPSFNKKYQEETLGLLGVKYKTTQKFVLFVSEVYIPNRLSHGAGHYNLEYLEKTKNLFLNILCNNISTEKKNRYYVTRGKNSLRTIKNEEELIIIFQQNGFIIVDFENLSIREQIGIAKNASIIISIHGAGLTNIMFCNKKTMVLEFLLLGAQLNKCYYNLAVDCNLNYYYQFCDSADEIQSNHFSDLIVDIPLFKANLKTMIENIDTEIYK